MFTLRNLPGKLALAALLLPVLAWAQDAEELVRQGERFLAEHQWEAAFSALQRAVKLYPGHAPAWKALGVGYASQGNYDRAEPPFRIACKLQPSLPDACLYYGRTLYLLNRFQPAIEVLRRTVQGEPGNGEAYRLLALSLEASGQTTEAGDAFLQAVRLNRSSSPNDDPDIDYAVFLFRQGKAETALAPLESALKRHPDAARAHLELGCVLLSLGRISEAASHLERSLALDPQSARAHLLLGKVYLRLDKPEAAERHLRQGSLTVK
jgi:Flp pilus assembly protein TadD